MIIILQHAMGGSNGNLTALKAVLSYDFNWERLIELFLFNHFELQRNKYTSSNRQVIILIRINYLKMFQRLCVVLINLMFKIWLDILPGKKYLKLRKMYNEVGQVLQRHMQNKSYSF